MDETKWSEDGIARALARNDLSGRSVLIVPRCHYIGHECDLLAVDRRSLRLIDIEIKISRADLKADAKKAKWWNRQEWHWRPGLGRMKRRLGDTRLDWPDKVWKHYYAVPGDIWDDKLLDSVPPASGVLLLSGSRGKPVVTVKRLAKPNKDAQPITAFQAIDLARLCTLRMWDALTR